MMTTMAAQRGGYNWGVFGVWFVASFVGMAVSMLAAFTLMWGVAGAVEKAAGQGPAVATAGAIMGLGLGLGTGLLPGLVLGQRLGGRGRWLLGSVLAGIVSGAILAPLAIGIEPNRAVWVLLAAAGAVVGLGQWLALRGHVARAGWWVLASTVAVGVGFGVALPLGGEGREALAIGGLALVHGLISAGVMGWLLSEGGRADPAEPKTIGAARALGSAPR